jgi:hypothetical protein
MKTIIPKVGNRIAVSLYGKDIAHKIKKIDINSANDFWEIHFGDDGVVVLDQAMIEEVLRSIAIDGRGDISGSF